MPYYIVGEGQSVLGPFSAEEMNEREIGADELICQAGSQDWIKASDWPQWPSSFSDSEISQAAVEMEQVPSGLGIESPFLTGVQPAGAFDETKSQVHPDSEFTEPHGFAIREQRSKWAMLGVGSTVLMAPISIWSSSRMIDFLKRLDVYGYADGDADAIMAEAEMLDSMEGAVGLIGFALYITAIVLFIRWFRVMANDLHARGKLDISVNAAVWSWFIPIISLYRPYQIVRQMIAEARQKGGAGFITGVWWAVWILSNLAANAMFRGDIGTIFGDDATIPQLIDSSEHDIFNEAGTFIAGLLCIATISLVTKASKSWPTSGVNASP